MGEHYEWYFVIAIIFMGLGGAKRWGKATKGGGEILMGAGVDSSRPHGPASLPELYLLILLFQPLFHL